jgi:hypothetical protein
MSVFMYAARIRYIFSLFKRNLKPNMTGNHTDLRLWNHDIVEKLPKSANNMTWRNNQAKPYLY